VRLFLDIFIYLFSHGQGEQETMCLHISTLIELRPPPPSPTPPEKRRKKKKKKEKSWENYFVDLSIPSLKVETRSQKEHKRSAKTVEREKNRIITGLCCHSLEPIPSNRSWHRKCNFRNNLLTYSTQVGGIRRKILRQLLYFVFVTSEDGDFIRKVDILSPFSLLWVPRVSWDAETSEEQSVTIWI